MPSERKPPLFTTSRNADISGLASFGQEIERSATFPIDISHRRTATSQ